MSIQTTWDEVQRRAFAPGPTILSKWRAEQEARRAKISNATYSQDVMDAFGVLPGGSAGMAVTPITAM
jgi:hypothetical protein